MIMLNQKSKRSCKQGNAVFQEEGNFAVANYSNFLWFKRVRLIEGLGQTCIRYAGWRLGGD